MAEGGGGGQPPDPGAVRKNKMANPNPGNKSTTGNDNMEVEREKYLYTRNDFAPYRVYVELTDKSKKNQQIHTRCMAEEIGKIPQKPN